MFIRHREMTPMELFGLLACILSAYGGGFAFGMAFQRNRDASLNAKAHRVSE